MTSRPAPGFGAPLRAHRRTNRIDATVLALLAAALLVSIGTRLWLSAALPLADTTEARYGEIVRVGLEHGFWRMPHVSLGEPFLAKPPGSTWLSMLAAAAFGPSEAALRLPSLLLMLGVAALCAKVTVRESGDAPCAGPWAAAVVLLSPLGFVFAGAVMTDALHLLAVTVAMAGATAVLTGDADTRASGRALFWCAIGAGALAKGVATVALAVLPLVLYGLATRRLAEVARALLAPGPVLAALAIALPWYAAAERAHPGFLHYFLFGEHLQRFLEPGWQGDRYGSAHHETIGTIWAFAALASGPWLIAAVTEARRLQRSPAPVAATTPAVPVAGASWWLCWILAPLLLFTFARNILWTYVATALPPLAVWLGASLARAPARRAVAAGALVWAFALTLAAPWMVQEVGHRSAKALIARIPTVDPLGTMPLTVPGELRFSGAFYSRGRACIAADAASEAACEGAAAGTGLRILALARARELIAAGSAEVVAIDAGHALLLRAARAGGAR